MNNLENAEKKRKRWIETIAIILVLNIFLILVFATNLGDANLNTVNNEVETPNVADDSNQNEDPTIINEGDTSIASVVTGANFTIALDSNGRVWSWGQNNKGQLGNGTLTDSVSKGKVLLNDNTQLTNIKQIAAGEYHAVALTNEGKVYMWGYNYFGQIGSTIKRVELYPQLIDIPNGVTIKQVACGADYTLMLTTNGKVLGIGDSSDGQLGYYNDLGFTSIREIEEQKATSASQLSNIQKIVAGYNHVIAVDENNQVWTWGDTIGSGFEFTQINNVTFGEGETIQEIEAGNGVSMALTSNGKVYTWNCGETPAEISLGDNVQVRTDSTKDNIAIINKTFYIIDENNNVYSWGQNNIGQTGTGDTSTVSTPTKLVMNTEAEINEKIDKVASSAIPGIDTSGNTNCDTAYAINTDGYVLGWGYAGTDIVDSSYTKGSNNFKLLGDGTRYVADYIGSISIRSIVGDDIILDITEEGIANNKNRLDLIKMLEDNGYITGGRVNLYRVEKANVLSSLEIKTVNDDIATFDNTTGIITGIAQGRTVVEVKSLKNTIYINVEVIGNNLTFPKIESGNKFTVALKADGTVWSWGYNTYLGIKDSKHSHSAIIVPTQVPGLENIKDISVGENFVLALKADGTVWSWGYNAHGELGNGTTTNSIVPVQVQTQIKTTNQDENSIYKNLENIISISASDYHALALDTNGVVWSWGYNGNGELGLGNTTNETCAKEVDLTNLVDEDGNKEVIRQVEAGKYTSYILTKSGRVYAFGYNGNYQCGMKGTYRIPTKVSALSGITKMSTNMYSNGAAFALTVNGKVKVLGNDNGTPITLGLENVVDIYGTSDNKYSAIAKFADGLVGYWTTSSATNDTITILKDTDEVENFTNAMIISGGYGFYTVAKTDGTVWTTGTNSYGQLGNRTTNAMALPRLKDISKAYISLNKNEVTLEIGKTETIGATHNYGFNLLHSDIEDVEMTYTSLNEEIATVTGNTITAKKSGTTYIVAEDTTSGTKLRLKVNVLGTTETTMPDISVGYMHTVALKTDGTVWGWGYNGYGELGYSGSKTIKAPEKIAVDAKIKDVEAGYYHTLMLTTDGKVLAMGYNGYGELGNNTTTNSSVPVTVQTQTTDSEGNIIYKDLENIVKIIAYYNTNLALDKDGNMYAWGYDSNRYATKVDTYGLKVRDISDRLVLTEDGRVWEYLNSRTLTYKEGLENIVQISSSAYSYSSPYGFYMALDADGNVYTWVKGTSTYNLVSGGETTVPTKVEFTDDVRIVDIEAGLKVAYAKDENGNVYTWGKNAYTGTLGLGVETTSLTKPTKIDTMENAEIMATSKHGSSYARTFISVTTGTVYGFGNNGSYSLLGNSDTTDYYYVPTQVGQSYLGFTDENGKEITRISLEKGTSKNIQTTFIDSFNIRNSVKSSKVGNYEWRVVNDDLLSLSATEGESNKVTANNIIGEAIVIAEEIDNEGNKTGTYGKLYVDVVETGTIVAPKMESTNNHTIALKADGTVWGWGSNVYYKNTSPISEPEQIKIAELSKIAVPTKKLNSDGTTAVTEDGKEIYEDKEGNEYLQVGNDYTDLSGKIMIKQDASTGALYAWDAEENYYKLNNILDKNEKPIVIVDIATSKNHTLLLTDSGEVYSFGYNGSGQLGYSTVSSYSYLPKKVEGLSDIVKIAVGDNYSLALDKYGTLWTFGYIHYHISGDKTCYEPIKSTLPKQLTKIGSTIIVNNLKNAIDITNQYILTKDGEVLSLQLQETALKAGTKLEGITGAVTKITRTSGNITSSGHTAFLTEDGKVFTTGYGTKGQLGNDIKVDSKNVAVQVLNEENTELINIKDIYVGENHTMAISKSGEVYTWGDNAYGQLRSKSNIQIGGSIARAYKVIDDDEIGKAILVSGGNGFTVVVDEAGYAFAWGLGTDSQLGNKLEMTSYEAVRVGTEGVKLNTNHVTLQENGKSINIKGTTNLLNLIYDKSVEVVSAQTSNMTTAIATKMNTDTITIKPVVAGTTSVTVKAKASTDKLFEDIVQVTVLPEVAEFADDIAKQIPAEVTIQPMTVSGKSHTLILKSDGTVWAYGDNTYGQTSAKDENGNNVRYLDEATKVKFPEGTSSIIAIAAGDAFSVALDLDGNVYTWGCNRNGQLGLGNKDANINAVPTKVNGISKITKVVAGTNQVIALDEDGYVYSWGRNNGGSLGIGSTSDVYVPTRIDNVANAIDVAAGEYHAMILTSSGKLYTTGRNTSGQLGRNATGNSYFEPVEIDERIAYIEAGDRASLAIDVNGKLWVWGNNERGQLGLGINDSRVIRPTQVTSLTEKVASASIGEDHIHVVTTSGKLYVAGANNYGQLGLGDVVENTNTFTQVSKFGTNVMNSDAGTTYSTVISKDGVVFGFGDYNQGNVDRLSLTNSFIPVMIANNTSYLDEQEVVINVGETYKINTNGRYKLNVLHKDNSSFTFESTNGKIATIDDKGIITGATIGTTTIKVKDEIGKINTVIVKVIPEKAIQAPTVEGGNKFAVVTDANGTSYLFGNQDNLVEKNIPFMKEDGLPFTKVVAGENFILAINKDKTVWSCGDNSNGQLGLENLESSDKINRLNRNRIKDIVQISAGSKHAIALDENGTAYVWGNNSNGQLGIAVTEDTTIITTPTAIRPVGSRIISISAGGNYSAIVDAEGKAYILRNGIANEIKGVTGAVKVATGNEHTIVLTNDGKVYKVDNSKDSAILVTSVSNKEMVDIAANRDAFMCLDKDKSLYTFGSNQHGKLGMGTITSECIIPSKVVEEDVFTMGAGYNNTYYINTQGEVLAAGLNTSGELGNGTSGNSDTTTYELSGTYTKVGNPEFELNPESVKVSTNWSVLVGGEKLQELAEETEKAKVATIRRTAEFNVFGNKVVDINDYNYELTDDTIATITDPSILKITTDDIGITKLKVINKATREEKELTIYVVKEELLRINNIYINDTVKDFIAEPDEDNKFSVNVQDSKSTGTLNIELAYNDELEVQDADGNTLTATRIPNTNNWNVNGLDLTKSIQKLKLILTAEDGTRYEFDLIIYKELIVKVNDEMLSSEDVLNKETLKTEKTYKKYVNPKDTTAEVEISVENVETTIQLEDMDGTVIATSQVEQPLTSQVNVPNIENKFIIKLINEQGRIENQYILKIVKSSIESINVTDIEEEPTQIVADRIAGTEYIEEFTATINDVNNPANVTINLGNKNIVAIKIDGVDRTSEINDSKLVISKDLTEDENKTTDVLVEITAKDIITNEEYTETHILRITTISSNNKVDYIELTYINNEEVSIKSKQVSDYEYEIVTHIPDVDFDGKVVLKALLKSNKAKYKFSNANKFNKKSGDECVLASSVTQGDIKKITENKYETTISVQAENGDIQVYTVYLYGASENAKISTIKVTGLPSNREEEAVKEEGTNNYIGKVLKNEDSYKLAIDLEDSYAIIESITIDGVDNVETLLTKTSGADGKYKFDAKKDIIGKTITIVVKPEFSKAPTETYTLVLEGMDDNAEFELVKVDATTFNNMEIENMEVNVKALENGELTVKAVSGTAKVGVYLVDPSVDTNETSIAEGTGNVVVNIPFDGERVKKLYLKVTSEDGLNSNIKTLTATKLSNNANIKEIFAVKDNTDTNKIQAIKDTTTENQYILDISETITNPIITVIPENEYAKVIINGEENINGTAIDISQIDSISITVISEDESVTEKYTLKINRLSANVNFTKELKDSTGKVIRSDMDFIKDTTVENQYNVSVADNLGDLTLTITPEDENTRVAMAISKEGTTDIAEKDRLYVDNNLSLPAGTSREVIVKLTPPDGTTREFKIKITSKHQILKSASVSGTNGETITLSDKQIKELSADIRIHPDTNRATVKVVTEYTPVELEAQITHPGMTDEDGNEIEEIKVNRTISSSSGTTFDVDLLEDINDVAYVLVKMTTADGGEETLTLTITRGSAEAILESVQLTGTTTGVKYKAEYINPIKYINEIVTNSEDTVFDLDIDVNNGTYKLYKLTEDIETWDTIDSTTHTEITGTTKIEQKEEPQVFVIVAKAEYGTKEEEYKFTVRKANNNNNIKDLTITTDDGKAIKHLTDFEEFTKDSTTNIMTTTVLVPSNIKKLTLSDLVLEDSKAMAEWTNIISATQSKNYTVYDGTPKELRNIKAIDLKGLRIKRVYIKVTAENGDVETYCIIIKKLTDDIILGDFSVYNVTDEKDEKVEENKSGILDTVKEIEVTGKAAGTVKLKVKEINGHIINENIVTSPEFNQDENKLGISLDRDYSYTDEEGATKTISSKEIRTIVVERTVQSQGYNLYPTYYVGSDASTYEKTDTLTITRLMSDASIIVKYMDNGIEKTITTDDFKAPTLVDGEIVRELDVHISSKEQNLIINNIKSNNEFATILHATQSGSGKDGLYENADGKRYERSIPEQDKAKVTEIVKVETEVEASNMTYKITFIKSSSDDSINKITVNNFESTREDDTDIYNNIVLAPANNVNIGVTDVEENAKVKVYISNINGTEIQNTNVNKDVNYGVAKEGRRDITKDLSAQLADLLGKANISRADLKTITVKIEVSPEDTSLSSREYTLNITVEKSNLISIDGLDSSGNVDSSAQLTAADFSEGSNPYSTKVIVIPAEVSKVELTNILCEADDETIVTDSKGNTLSDRSLTINVEDNEITETIIKVSLRGVEQTYKIRIRKASTDTSIKEITADKSRTDAIDETTGAYVLNIKDTMDPEVEVILNDANAKITSAKHIMADGSEVDLSVENGKFKVSEIATTTHSDTGAEDIVTIKVKVQPENKSTSPEEHTIQLVKQHTETGLARIMYKYDNSQIIELDYTVSENKSLQIIPSNREGIIITSATAVCNRARVYLENDDGTKVPIDTTKLYEIEEGTTRTFTIIVQSEYGNEKTYTFKVKRLSSNTKLTNIKVNTGTETVTAEYDETKGMYTADIKVTEDAEIVIVPESSYTKLIGTPKVYRATEGDLSGVTIPNIEDTKFAIDGLSGLYVNDETEDKDMNRFIIVEFTVAGEDTNATKTYKLQLTRRHIDASISDISYSYVETVTAEDGTTSQEPENGTLTLDATTPKEILVEKTVEEVKINKLVPNCNKATVKIAVDGTEVTQTDDGFTVNLEEEISGDGCIRTVEVTVIAEAGETAKYEFNVIRMSTNASLGKVYVKGVEAVREESTEEAYEAIFKANILDTDTMVALQATSANRYATVSIPDSNYITDGNNNYNETGKYDLMNAISTETKEVVVEIVVTPQSAEAEPKTYKLIMTRQNTSTILELIDIKPESDGVTDGPIHIGDNDTHTSVFSLNETKNYLYSPTIEIPTAWEEISLGDIFPSEPELSAKITRISSENPHNANNIEEYEINSKFDISKLEGQKVYFKVVTTSEAGNTNENQPYVITLYKKATNTNLMNINVNEKQATLDDADNIYKVDIESETDPIKVVLNAENNLSVAKTEIKSIDVNGRDLTTTLGISRTGSGKQVSFTLSDIVNNLDDITDKVVTLKITVQPEDETVASKEYTLQITRKYSSTILEQIAIKPASDGVTDEAIIIHDNNTHTEDFSLDRTKNYLYSSTIEIPTAWEEISLGDILPNEPELSAKITRISSENPHTADSIEEYEINSKFDISKLEGQKVYFKVVTTTESGNTNENQPYVITLYKKATNANLMNINVNEKQATLDEADNIYKVDIESDTDPIKVVLDAENNLSVANTKIKSIVANGRDVTTTLEISKTGSGKQVSFTLSDIVNNLDDITDKVLTLKITVQPEDETVASKEYTLQITRKYSSTILKQIAIKPASDGVTDEAIIIHDNNTHTADFSLNETNNYLCSTTIEIPTAWEEISLGDILPNEPELSAKITRISSENPHTADSIEEYEIDSKFDISKLEGQKVYFKVVTTTEAGNTNENKPYVITLYKKATNTNLMNINVNEKEATLDDADNIYKVNINANDNTIKVVLNAENNLSVDKTEIKSIVVNGRDVTTTLERNRTGSSRQVSFTLSDILNKLDYNTDKVVTLKVTVQPEDETIASKEYTIQITRQHTSVEVDSIIIDKDKSTEKTENGVFTYNSNTKRYEKTINVSSQVNSVTVNEINLECASATKVITVDGVVKNLPFDVELPNEESTKTVKIEITPELEGASKVERYIIIRRMSADDSLNRITTQKKYIDDNGKTVITSAINASVDPTDSNKYTQEILVDQDTTIVTAWANKASARIEMSLVDILDKEGNSIKTGNELTNIKYYSTNYQLYYYTRQGTLDTSVGRTFIIKFAVQSEDLSVPKEEYTLTIIKLDDSADIKTITGNDEEISIDSEDSHYQYIGNNTTDIPIYTQYIDADTTEVVTDITTVSKFAKIYLNEDYNNIVGTGKVEDYKVQITEDLTQVKIRVVSEDEKTTKDYLLWFIKKSNDVSIKEVYVDDKLIPANKEDGNYYVEISDLTESIDVRMIPNYKLAKVSVNGQPFKWQETEETISRLEDEVVCIELRVDIPALQSATGKEGREVKYLYVTRVSTSNEIAEILTDNYNDDITPGNSPQDGIHNGIQGFHNTYVVNLDETTESREYVDLRIEPVSPTATLKLYNMNGDLINSSAGTLVATDIQIDSEEITTVRVEVIPKKGEAKEYYIDLVPKENKAELISIIIGGKEVPIVPGQYEYTVSDYGLVGKGSVEATAEYDTSKINIYTKGNPTGVGEQYGKAILENVDFENTKFVKIAVTSPNGRIQRTYTLCLKEVDDDRTMKKVSYNTTGNSDEKVEVEMKPLADSDYLGEYTIQLEPEADNIYLTFEATSPVAGIEVEGISGNPLDLTKNLTSINKEVVLDIIVTAESENQAKYKLTIKKPTIISGKVVTENINKNYAGINIQVLDNEGESVANGETQADGTFNIEVPSGDKYKVVIKKDGYLKHTVINIPATYGVRRYVGIVDLVAGEVNGNDEYIDLRDLVQVNRRAMAVTAVDSSNEKYDFNEDGKIDPTDLDILIKNYDKKSLEVEYTRFVNIVGEVRDNTNALVPNATIEMSTKVTTNENGEFKLGDIALGQYTLIVKDSEGNTIGSDNISIVEGNEYKISHNVITVTPSTNLVDLTVTVNGARAVVSKRGEETDEDITKPTNVTLDAEIVDNGIKLTASAEDSNLSKFTFYTEEGVEIGSKTVTGVTSDTVEITKAIPTQFNKVYEFYVVVEDAYKNSTKQTVKVTDNIIRKADDLKEFSNLVNGVNGISNNYEGQVVTLANNLSLEQIEFNPIGKSSASAFKGTFDGKGHTISNININATANYAGLFGYVNGATIKNVGIESGNINSTKGYVGAIAGYSVGNTIIENCYNKANVSAEGNHVGGIVGQANGAVRIINCYNAGEIKGKQRTAGIIATLPKEGTIENCYNIGEITSSDTTSTAIIGEIVAYKIATRDRNTGNIVTGSVTNCYYLGTNKGIGAINVADSTEEELAGILSDTTKSITDTSTLLTDLGSAFKSDFVDQVNNGYPILAWEEQTKTIALMSLREEALSLPVATDYAITSEFGTRIDPITKEESDMHYGMDIAAAYKTPILAVADGIVTYAGENGGYGYCIEIEHEINGEKVYSFYAHLYQIDVKVGDTITKGQQIALEGGKPGDAGAGTSTGAHLHFEIRKISGSYSSAVDPRNYLEF